MKAWKILSMISLVLVWSAALVAQDAVKVDPAHYTVVLENASVRVLKINYPAGSKSIAHHHPDAIVVPLAASSVRFATPDGKTQDVEMPSESATYSPAGVHTPSNIGKGAISAVLIEFKTAAPGKAVVPTTRDGMKLNVLAEGPRAVAVRSTASPTFAEPAGTKHDYDQIVIALGTAPISLSIDGKPAKTTWVRGETVFIGRGVAHESRNTGGKPVDMIIVSIR